MATQTVAFRVAEEEKNYIYDLTGSRNVPLSKFLKDLCRDLQNGEITYDGNGFKAKCECKHQNSAEISPLKADDVDLSELYSLAEDRRVTPQSILNNALRPYRRKNFDDGVQSDE